MNQNERGRSMVEMLGVLAVIGVLSIAGISGYKHAMDMYKTNKALQLIDLFALSAKEASYSNNLSGYAGNNSHSTCFCYATQWFCDNYLGKNDCGKFQTTTASTYKVKDYHGIKFFVYNGNNGPKVSLRITETTASVCKAVIERVYKTYHDDLPSEAFNGLPSGGNTFNIDFKTEEWEEAIKNCDEQAEENGEHNVVVEVKFNYIPLEKTEDLIDCRQLYPNICSE